MSAATGTTCRSSSSRRLRLRHRPRLHPTPVTQLPNTGTGVTSPSASDDLMIGIALLGVTGAAGAYALNRRLRRNAA